MAKTLFNKISSQDILSAHINGLANGINNLETALNMKTSVIKGHILNVVNDMEQIENRNKLYEGSIRNWLTSPAPIVYKNGVVVNANDYIIQPAYGVIVFHNALSTNDVISVDVTHINGESSRLDTIEENVSSLETAIENIPTSSGGGSTEIEGFNGNALISKTRWISNHVRHTKLPTKTVVATKYVNDFTPFVVKSKTIIDSARFYFNSTSSADAETMFAIYTNRNDLGFPYPDKCISKSDGVTIDSTRAAGWVQSGMYEFDYETATKGTLEVVLEPGIYWVGKATYDTLSAKAFDKTQTDVISISPPSLGFPVNAVYDSLGSDGEAYGIRATMSAWSLPPVFPEPVAGSIGFTGEEISNVYVRKAR